MINRVRDYLRSHPVQVRAAIAGALLLAGQLIPAVQDLAGSELMVDAITAGVLAALGADAVRVTRTQK